MLWILLPFHLILDLHSTNHYTIPKIHINKVNVAEADASDDIEFIDGGYQRYNIK